MALRRAEPSLGERERLRVEIAEHRAGSSAPAAATAAGSSRQAPMLSGEIDSTLGSIGPGRADADGDRRHVVVLRRAVEHVVDEVGERVEQIDRVEAVIDATCVRSISSPRIVIRPAASFVPPMSTARTTSRSAAHRGRG